MMVERRPTEEEHSSWWKISKSVFPRSFVALGTDIIRDWIGYFGSVGADRPVLNSVIS